MTDADLTQGTSPRSAAAMMSDDAAATRLQAAHRGMSARSLLDANRSMKQETREAKRLLQARKERARLEVEHTRIMEALATSEAELAERSASRVPESRRGEKSPARGGRAHTDVCGAGRDQRHKQRAGRPARIRSDPIALRSDPGSEPDHPTAHRRGIVTTRPAARAIWKTEREESRERRGTPLGWHTLRE